MWAQALVRKKLDFHGALLSIILVGSMLLGCGGVQYVDNADSREYASLGIDYHDLEKAASDNIKSLLESGYVRSLAGLEKPKVLAISNVINDTMQHFSTQELTRKITRDMRNSGKFILTMAFAGSGGSKDTMLDSVREARGMMKSINMVSQKRAVSSPQNYRYLGRLSSAIQR